MPGSGAASCLPLVHCKLDLDDKVPHHSTFSVNRLGRFRESEILRHIFERVVAACMVAGLVKGEGFAVDASVMEANAGRYHRKAPDELDWTDAQRAQSVTASFRTMRWLWASDTEDHMKVVVCGGRNFPLREAGAHVIIDGECISACTVVTSLSPSKVCIRAELSFHSAFVETDDGRKMFSPDGTSVIWHEYPKAIRDMLKGQGLGRHATARDADLARPRRSRGDLSRLLSQTAGWLMHHDLHFSDGALIISTMFFLAAALLTRYIHGSDQ